jgi:hypothetical protein
LLDQYPALMTYEEARIAHVREGFAQHGGAFVVAEAVA